jgi:hypothetical protein
MNLEVQLLSLLTKGVSSYNKSWVFELIIQSPDEVILAKRIEYNLEPYTVTGYLTQVRWLSQQEFANFFLASIDELLGTNPLRPNPIKLGNDQYVNNLIESNIPQFKTNILSANGAYIAGGNSAYAIDGKEERILSPTNYLIFQKTLWILKIQRVFL